MYIHICVNIYYIIYICNGVRVAVVLALLAPPEIEINSPEIEKAPPHQQPQGRPRGGIAVQACDLNKSRWVQIANADSFTGTKVQMLTELRLAASCTTQRCNNNRTYSPLCCTTRPQAL